MTLFFFSLFYTPVHRGLHPAILPSFTVMATKQCSVLCHPEKASQALLQSDPIVTPSKMLPQCSPLPLKAGDAAEQQNEQAWRERRYTGSHGGMAKIFLAQLKIDPEEKKRLIGRQHFVNQCFLVEAQLAFGVGLFPVTWDCPAHYSRLGTLGSA